uniref:Uncharacterized protein n=1 Tax=mine drainage metagenome TaxID=410659 RepID=E6QSM7_9ZZZZ
MMAHIFYLAYGIHSGIPSFVALGANNNSEEEIGRKAGNNQDGIGNLHISEGPCT